MFPFFKSASKTFRSPGLKLSGKAIVGGVTGFAAEAAEKEIRTMEDLD